MQVRGCNVSGKRNKDGMAWRRSGKRQRMCAGSSDEVRSTATMPCKRTSVEAHEMQIGYVHVAARAKRTGLQRSPARPISTLVSRPRPGIYLQGTLRNEFRSETNLTKKGSVMDGRRSGELSSCPTTSYGTGTNRPAIRRHFPVFVRACCRGRRPVCSLCSRRRDER